MNAETMQILRDAKGFIVRGWTQGRNARAADGEGVEPASEHAVCWCLHGAVARACTDLEYPAYHEAMKTVENHLEGTGVRPVVTEWNDVAGRTQKEVLDMLDDVIGNVEDGS